MDHEWVRHTMELVEVDEQGNVVRVLGESRVVLGCNQCDLEYGDAQGAPCLGSISEKPLEDGG